MKPNRRTFLATSSAGLALAQQPAPPALPPFHTFDAALPALSPGRVKSIHITSQEVPVCIKPGLVVAGWTFDGDIPGPVIHVREGDTVEFTLTNRGMMPHSMDFHCALVNPKAAFRNAKTDESVSFQFTARYPGAYLYHCGTQPILMHIGSGMFGAIVVSPAKPLAPAREFVLVQSEYYLNEAINGVASPSFTKMMRESPDIVAFNGRPGQYHQSPLRAKRGERVRFYVVAAGPSHPSHFHVVGQQFETVFLGTPPANAIHGVQTFSVPPGGGMIFELTAEIPGEFPFVNHGFGHGQKGATGVLLIDE